MVWYQMTARSSSTHLERHWGGQLLIIGTQHLQLKSSKASAGKPFQVPFKP